MWKRLPTSARRGKARGFIKLQLSYPNKARLQTLSVRKPVASSSSWTKFALPVSVYRFSPGSELPPFLKFLFDIGQSWLNFNAVPWQHHWKINLTLWRISFNSRSRQQTNKVSVLCFPSIISLVYSVSQNLQKATWYIILHVYFVPGRLILLFV